METHDNIVAGISTHIKEFYKQQKPFRLYHGATNSTRPSVRRADNTIDISSLNSILLVDESTKTVLVEPNVPMDVLIRTTLQYNLLPLVVMELPGITVGGGFSGTSLESSSFRYGAFDATVNYIEIVLPDGLITKASKREKPDLFWGAASAFGTLGVVTLLELQLRDAKKYVKLDYLLSSGAADTLRQIKEECAKEDNDYVEATALSARSTVIGVGKLSDDLPEGIKPMHFTRRGDPWFYTRIKEVEKELLKEGVTKVTDYVVLEDYLFRWDRGGFWTGEFAFNYVYLPSNRVTQYLADGLLRGRKMFQALHESRTNEHFMIQDVGVPFDRFEEFLTWLDEELEVKPIWLCPLRVRRDDPDSGHGLHSDFADPDYPDLMNVGVWRNIEGNRQQVIEQNLALERKLRELGGKKWLYAVAYYTEEEFWVQYDRKSYDALRVKYNAAYLPSIYDKIRVDMETKEMANQMTWWMRVKMAIWNVWPIPLVWGFLRAATGDSYVLKK